MNPRLTPQSGGSPRQRQGAVAEQAVASHLTRQGYFLLAANYRVPRLGELDLVMQRGRTIYVIEVKARTSAKAYGGALAAITPAKLARLRRTTQFFLQEKRIMNTDISFLAAAATLTAQGTVGEIQVVPIEYL